MPAPDFVFSLLSWYDANQRDLPWRDHPDPYAVLISEFMLQQTTVPAVIPYFEKWMKVYPTVKDLSDAEPSRVLRSWEGLGYYSRARNLHAAAREIVGSYEGRIPSDPGDLKKLPGVGDYTAAAVASMAYGIRTPALDANNLRVWSRLLISSDRKRITRVFTRVLPQGRPGDFNQALMDLGSSVCTPKDPRCSVCPLTPWCRAHRRDRVSEFPVKRIRRETEAIEAAVGIILRDGKILVQRRPDTGLMAGLWEFPGGKLKVDETQSTRRDAEGYQKPGGRAVPITAVKATHTETQRHGEGTTSLKATESTSRKTAKHANKDFDLKEGKSLSPKRPSAHAPMQAVESPEEAVVREVREETGLRVQVCEKLGIFNHAYTRFRVKLHVFICKRKAGTVHNPAARWVTPEELEGLAMPSVNRRIVRKLEKKLNAQFFD